jgi:cytokinin dehydrogenase
MPFDKLREELDGQVFDDEETLAEVQNDFGGLTHRVPSAVVLPAGPADVSTVLKHGVKEGWTVSTRGTSHSQSGQSLNSGGILLDVSGLNRIERVGRYSAWVQAGVLWSDLVRVALEGNLIPPVLTGYLDVTVGGTLSTGGVGAASYKHGYQALHVEELEVVTGEGHLVRCSLHENRDLFDCTRAGLGLFSVITRAKIRLRPCAPRVRVFYLLYDSLRTLMRDLDLLSTEERFEYLEGFAVPCPIGYRSVGETKMQFAEWFYLLQVAVEHGQTAPEDESLLDGLHFFRKVHVEDMSQLGFATRQEPLYTHWRETGTWDFSHPWMETALPWDKARPYITGVLRSIPPNLLTGGLVTLQPLTRDRSNLPLLVLPEGERLMHFGILPAVPRQFLAMVLPLLMKASELSIEMGGKRYLSGWIDFDQPQWKAHFAERWDQLNEWKRFFDPKGILNPGFVPFDTGTEE